MGGTGLFVTATDTEVGKTVVTAGLALTLRQRGTDTEVMKPVQSGHMWNDPQGDIWKLWNWTNSRTPLEELIAYSYAPAVAPALAARLENRPILLEPVLEKLDRLRRHHEVVLVEGAGGLMVPLGRDWTVADLALAIGWPLVIVARPTLGTINHTVLTVMAARLKGLEPAGIILNGQKQNDSGPGLSYNVETIQQLTGVPVLGVTPWMDVPLTPDRLQTMMSTLQLDPLLKRLRKENTPDDGKTPVDAGNQG
ncbi:dethiobiotin synthase [Desmospora profundinema]|uniref:ATP-dependent dethiobiotin synthetase BioD n=1 Tax=Desmospora profundinema TaxID=1571184 RepID=A0ABU1ILE1_9BACL|nr:dethiobiotin synthase [Desmospora profundinema]MDR6224774.1 dethiobiotin synthetase [Desmospora profundinema]